MNEKQFDPELAKTLFPEPKPSYRPWAQKRNFAKYKLVTTRFVLHNMIINRVLVEPERTHIDLILHHVNALLKRWDSRNEASKQKFGKR
jgi:hypothetical protein